MENYKTIEEYILNIGVDLRDCDLSGVDMTRADLRNVLLPDDVDLFLKIKNRSLLKTKLPELDYSKYNFENVILNGTEFQYNSKLPNQKDLFQIIFNKELYETKLPKININEYDFGEVKISKTIFTKDSVVGDDKELFQKIYNKSLYGTVMPIADYSEFNFKDVQIIGTNFQEKSILPSKLDFFQNIFDKSALKTMLPATMLTNISMYNLTDVEIDLTLYKINIFKIYNIYEKYKDNSNIIYPDFSMTYRKGKQIHIKNN